MDDRKKAPTKVGKTSLPKSLGNLSAKLEVNEPQSPLLTLTEAAFRLGRVHRTTIMRWVKEGRLNCVRLSRKAVLFETAEVDRFIREHRYSGR